MIFNFILFKNICDIFANFSIYFFNFIDGALPPTSQEKGRGEIFNPSPLVSPPRTAPS
jgi:hypothetical protein